MKHKYIVSQGRGFDYRLAFSKEHIINLLSEQEYQNTWQAFSQHWTNPDNWNHVNTLPLITNPKFQDIIVNDGKLDQDIFEQIDGPKYVIIMLDPIAGDDIQSPQVLSFNYLVKHLSEAVLAVTGNTANDPTVSLTDMRRLLTKHFNNISIDSSHYTIITKVKGPNSHGTRLH